MIMGKGEKGRGKFFLSLSNLIKYGPLIPIFLVGCTLGVGLTFTFSKYSRGAKLTFLFMEGFVWRKGENYSLGASLTSLSKKGKGAKREGAKLTFFIYRLI